MMLLAELDIAVWVSRALHLLAAMATIGGAIFVRIALLPAMRQTLSTDENERVHQAVRKRWIGIVHASVTLLLLTGGLNYYWLALKTHVKPMPYHPIFLIKVLAALFIFFTAIALTGTSPGFSKMRERKGTWLTAIILAGALIVLLSGVLNQVRTTGAS